MEKAYYDNAEVDIVGPPEHHDLEHDPFAAHEEKLKKAPKVEVIDLPAAKASGSKPTSKGGKGSK